MRSTSAPEQRCENAEDLGRVAESGGSRNFVGPSIAQSRERHRADRKLTAMSALLRQLGSSYSLCPQPQIWAADVATPLSLIRRTVLQAHHTGEDGRCLCRRARGGMWRWWLEAGASALAGMKDECVLFGAGRGTRPPGGKRGGVRRVGTVHARTLPCRVSRRSQVPPQ